MRLLFLARSLEDASKEQDHQIASLMIEAATELKLAALKEEGAPAWIKRHVNYQGDECLIHPFRMRNGKGYAMLAVNRKPVGAHRYMCELAHGAPPEPGMHAAHFCGVRDCVNPRHLRWATVKENHADKITHGTHNRGSQHYSAKLTEEQVTAILPRLRRGESQSRIATEVGVSRGTIKAIARGKTWKHITEGNLK
jgi:hypothetical protein